jgi:predicted O-methyltransferase YrrM
MEFSAFYERFGGSFRTKNLTWVPERASDPSPAFVNRRVYRMPAQSGLPQEFIRLDPWEGEYLFMVARRAKRQIVEIGRFYGGSTFLLACANDRAAIVSVDLQPQDDSRLEMLLKEHRVGSNLTILVGDSQRTQYPAVGPIDLLFIDGDHSYEGCTADLENWYPKVLPGGHIVLHDSYCGCAVQDAIVDFTARHAVEHVRWPYIIASHWHTSYGSMCHFMKKE